MVEGEAERFSIALLPKQDDLIEMGDNLLQEVKVHFETMVKEGNKTTKNGAWKRRARAKYKTERIATNKKTQKKRDGVEMEDMCVDNLCKRGKWNGTIDIPIVVAANHYETFELELPGLGNSRTVQDLCSMAEKNKCNIVFIMETKLSNKKCDRIKRRLACE